MQYCFNNSLILTSVNMILSPKQINIILYYDKAGDLRHQYVCYYPPVNMLLIENFSSEGLISLSSSVQVHAELHFILLIGLTCFSHHSVTSPAVKTRSGSALLCQILLQALASMQVLHMHLSSLLSLVPVRFRSSLIGIVPIIILLFISWFCNTFF